jgi:hypothetical protein
MGLIHKENFDNDPDSQFSRDVFEKERRENQVLRLNRSLSSLSN